MVNQIETHPLYTEFDTIELCKQHDILIEAYSPLAQNNKKLNENEVIVKIAQNHGIEVSKVILSYLLGKGYIILPRSSKENHIASNI